MKAIWRIGRRVGDAVVRSYGLGLAIVAAGLVLTGTATVMLVGRLNAAEPFGLAAVAMILLAAGLGLVAVGFVGMVVTSTLESDFGSDSAPFNWADSASLTADLRDDVPEETRSRSHSSPDAPPDSAGSEDLGGRGKTATSAAAEEDPFRP